MDRHPTALGRHLDDYLAAVAGELRDRGVITCSPQRSDPAQRLIGSIVIDCTALRLAAWTPQNPTAGATSLDRALHPERPAPAIATWDEHTGWCVGMHHDPTRASRRYLHPDLLPVPTAVADSWSAWPRAGPSATTTPSEPTPSARLRPAPGSNFYRARPRRPHDRAIARLQRSRSPIGAGPRVTPGRAQ